METLLLGTYTFRTVTFLWWINPFIFKSCFFIYGNIICGGVFYLQLISFKLFFLRFYFFLERRREGERDGEKHHCVVAYCTPPSGDLTCSTGICPRLGIEPVTLWFIGWQSDHWATPARVMYGFFKENCLRVQQFLTLTQSPLVLASRSYGDLPSWLWNPGFWGMWCGAGTHCSWDNPSQSFIHHTWTWDQSIPRLHPLYRPGWMWFP